MEFDFSTQALIHKTTLTKKIELFGYPTVSLTSSKSDPGRMEGLFCLMIGVDFFADFRACGKTLSFTCCEWQFSAHTFALGSSPLASFVVCLGRLRTGRFSVSEQEPAGSSFVRIVLRARTSICQALNSLAAIQHDYFMLLDIPLFCHPIFRDLTSVWLSSFHL